MVWVIIIVGIIIVFAISSASNKAKEAASKVEATAITTEKSLAYKDYLKRTSQDSEIQSMTDNELNEFIASNMREYNAEANSLEDGFPIIVTIILIGTAFIVGVSESLIPIVAGILLVFWMSYSKKSGMEDLNSKFKAKGLEPDRLRIKK